MNNRADIVLAKFSSHQSMIEDCEWDQGDEKVARLLGKLKEQEKQLQALFKKLVGTQSVEIKEKWDELIKYLDKETTAENMPTDDKDTFLKKLQTLSDNITPKIQALESAITKPQTTEVAPAA
ncbi:hypothetical protein NEUTE1DRAFT_111358 [Neurospora tetrasperma FGSC 2508]|uniref:Uncharacterized protein n=1 Tax=Neurospora tetrasperma (strain FGSC 2508 / ATCC MYA-4615 / P0657) TaxID=510951 RepID=F8MNK8_NEUT8|nr:uncharacterized protein NEUTE1DRAFT_111358 [Neurospora tetrasperma FGSC 2508]EGO56976.1 hypothetical protein NEUTE1DRAFT_111358 [Neurospora tetrasperma FGSC 2508]EGZ72577.1 hypothetical protein NEUTE2DRAFT_142291 [Neurospora tetrasperma FGSC 2509]